MTFQNAKYNRDGSIDCMIDHPKLGLVPFTARASSPPDDTSYLVYHDIIASGKVEAYVP